MTDPVPLLPFNSAQEPAARSLRSPPAAQRQGRLLDRGWVAVMPVVPLLVALVAACAVEPEPVTVPESSSVSLTPEAMSGPPEDPSGYIVEDDNGSSFTYVEASRFGFWLDEASYPFDDLDTGGCDFLGQVTNWSLRGPDRYPIGFEVTGKGTCKVRNGDFAVEIVATSANGSG